MIELGNGGAWTDISLLFSRFRCLMYHYFGPLSLMYCDLQIFMALILFLFISLSLLQWLIGLL